MVEGVGDGGGLVGYLHVVQVPLRVLLSGDLGEGDEGGAV